ncbi:MAG: choloylglycine hydrolase [Lachnospiraceae bacterium]|nr:choloylglycine hydrolase [Lachnospiraceae bacterium]
MCTALTYSTDVHYFGRNLDLEYSYNETVTITPRNYPFVFRRTDTIKNHYAMIGMAYVTDGYPLYYDATNEMGLSMASLNFPEYAHYNSYQDGKDNISTFELIPWIIGQCKNVEEAKKLLACINITDDVFNDMLPLGTLHWIIADRNSAITVEAMKDGLKIFDNTIGILTNSPPFEVQMFNLNNYMSVTAGIPVNVFSDKIDLKTYSRGMGGIGLPGDFSSMSRFIRATFVKLNSVCNKTGTQGLSQFFHILNAVAHPRGCVCMGNNKYEVTVYSSCCDVDNGIYYYTTYDNSQITGVSMHNEQLDASELVSYPLITGQQIRIQN